jgi:hypothetical protein
MMGLRESDQGLVIRGSGSKPFSKLGRRQETAVLGTLRVLDLPDKCLKLIRIPKRKPNDQFH